MAWGDGAWVGVAGAGGGAGGVVTKNLCHRISCYYNQSMLTVIETEEFMAWAAQVWSDAERHAFIDWIADNPEAGDVIPGSGGLRKVRWSRSGMGKRGGARVIYFTRNARGELVLVLVYAKAKFDNISTDVLKAIKEKLDAQDQRP